MKKTVFITGATGTMGWAGFTGLLRKKDRFDIRILARPSKKNIRKLAPYLEDPAVTVVWGDLMNVEDVIAGAAGADFILHVGGMVSPQADYYPEKTLKVNVTAAENVVKAVKAQPDPDKVKVVYIGSVAECGDRLPPIHWGCTGEPVYGSKCDKYSVSKVLSERVIVESGLKHWVSLRLSAILHPGLFKQINPVLFHVPLRGVLEWTTLEDAGRVLANVVEEDVPDEFWNRFYNLSSGPEYRLSTYEFQNMLFRPLGISSLEHVFEPRWFVLRNFHGMWYTDGDVLENYLHFRGNVPLKEYVGRLIASLPWYMPLARLVPNCLIKCFMKKLAYEKGLGTQTWTDDPVRMKAFYGSREEFENLTSWEQVRPAELQKDLKKAEAAGEVVRLDKGYDDGRSIYALSSEELKSAAAFRGGRFLGPEELIGTKGAMFDWECENGHRFKASLEYVLLGGGWCSECDVEEVFDQTTRRNRFISAVLYPQSLQ